MFPLFLGTGRWAAPGRVIQPVDYASVHTAMHTQGRAPTSPWHVVYNLPLGHAANNLRRKRKLSTQPCQGKAPSAPQHTHTHLGLGA